MKKDAMERMCREAGLVPVRRDRIAGADVFIADGFSSPPHHAYRRFGVGADEFPLGAYVTMWLVAQGDEIDTGQTLFFDAMHNPEIERSSRQGARANAALKEAGGFISARNRVQLNG